MSLFGDRLRELRKRRGYSNQGKIAAALGISQQQYSLYERGREPKYEMLIEIANLLKTTADYLVGRSPIPERTIDDLSADEQALILKYRSKGHKPTDTDADLDFDRDNFPIKPKPRRKR